MYCIRCVCVCVCGCVCVCVCVCVHVLDGVIKADHNILHCLVTTRQQDGILCLVGVSCKLCSVN